MAPHFVKPYVKSNKNDANDAEAIAEAVMRPNMRFVSPKSVEQQDMQCLHRVGSRLVACRTQLVTRSAGCWLNRGIILPQHVAQLHRGLFEILEDAENGLSGSGRRLFAGLYEELIELEKRVEAADHGIQVAFRPVRAARGLRPWKALVR